jgi:hypothetical protein
MIEDERDQSQSGEPNDSSHEAGEPTGDGAPSEPESAAAVEAQDVPVEAPPVEAPAESTVDPAIIDPEIIAAARRAAKEAADAAVLATSRRHTRRSFLVGGLAAAAAYGFHRYLETTDYVLMQPPPFQDAYHLNAALSRTIFRNKELAPTYPLSRAENLRVNGIYGLKMDLEPESWRMQLVGMLNDARHPRYVEDVTAWEYTYKAPPSNQDTGHDTKVDPSTAAKMAPEEKMDQAQEDENHTGRKPRGFEEAGESESTLSPGTPGLLLHMEDITKLPRQELVTQFKCIEGWSQIVHWAGYRMADFLELYPPAPIDGREPRYVYMETPDGDYYTGYDLDVLRHPQTLLVTEMMGAPLTQSHGAPLRLHMPTKYGYKQIKRIGLIAYTNDKPDDYWTKLGYDWYAGL